MQPAILNIGRLNNFRLNHVPAALLPSRINRIRLLLNGIDARLRLEAFTIHDVLNEAPNTASIVLGRSAAGLPAHAPAIGDAIRITMDANAPTLLFAGTIQRIDQSYEGTSANPVYRCSASDDTAIANRRRPFGAWTNTSATTIAAALTAQYAPGLTTTHVATGLPAVSIIFDGSRPFVDCLAALAKQIGGYCKVEYGEVWLFLQDLDTPPDPVDGSPGRLLNDPPFTVTPDLSQLQTRIFGKGHSETVTTDVSANETILPVGDTTMFNPLGGRAIAGTTAEGAQSQQITYTGTQPGGPGSLVGLGAAPTVAPALAMQGGSGVESGAHEYAITFVTATGESLVGPRARITLGPIPPPATEPHAGPAVGPGIAAGSYDYVATFLTPTGETTISPSNGVTLAGGPADPTRICTPVGHNSTPGSALSGTFTYVYTFRRTSDGVESGPSPQSAPVSIVYGDVWLDTSQCDSPPAGYTRRWYRSGGVILGFGSSSGAYLIDNQNSQIGSTHPPAASNFVGRALLQLIPTGPASVTGRRLYRRAGTGPYQLVTTINDNVTTTYTDATPTGSLGGAPPSTNTAGANQVVLSSIPTGPAAVTARKLYRTAAGGSVLGFLVTIANNTTTTYTDAAADATRGAAPPASDTSGLSFAGGQVNAGSTALPVASSAPFPAQGWVALVGDQVVRYGGISGNTLTGIPASGPGAIQSTVLYGSAALPSPALTGVSGLVAAVAQGSKVAIFVQRDDLVAQAERASFERAAGIVPADGVYEGPMIVDERRIESSLIALCDATLQRFSRPIYTYTYATRDRKSRSGKTVHLAVPTFPGGDVTIQDVTITCAGGASPVLFRVTASSVRFSLEDVLRRLGA